MRHRDTITKVLITLIDLLAIFFSIYLAYVTRNLLAGFFGREDTYTVANYLSFYLIYFVVIMLFLQAGVYTQRYDFWHESRIVLKSLFFALLILLAYLAATKSVQNYSRAVLIIAFAYMGFLIPLFKNIGKKWFYKRGMWRCKVMILGEDPSLSREIIDNPYLGYSEVKNTEKGEVLFITSSFAKNYEKDFHIPWHESKDVMHEYNEVNYIPRLQAYDMTHSYVYRLSNIQTNIITFRNRLRSKYRRRLKWISDWIMAIVIFPLLLPILLVIAYKIRKEEPGSTVLFRQERLGREGAPFVCYKFRTMHEDGDSILREYLEKHPEELEYYSTYHKYRNDPRITRIGDMLRRTSLDELPQIFNVFKGEMSLIGPRPYMLNEKEKIGENLATILTVLPGITGLWQVSGRNDVDFHSRVKLDVWYIRNWNLWMDFVILLKTVKTVLLRNGAS